MAIYVCLCVCVFCQDPKPNGLETSVIAKIVKVRNYQIRFKPFLRKNYLKLTVSLHKSFGSMGKQPSKHKPSETQSHGQ